MIQVKYFVAVYVGLFVVAASAQTNAPITVRGVPLGKPGVNSQIRKMCDAPPPYSDPKRKVWCHFETGIPSAPAFDYESFIGLATFSLSLNGESLEKFEFKGKSADTSRLIQKLERKLGTSSKVLIPEYSEGKIVGTITVYRWKDKRGSVLTVSPDGKVEAVSPRLGALIELIDSAQINSLRVGNRR